MEHINATRPATAQTVNRPQNADRFDGLIGATHRTSLVDRQAGRLQALVPVSLVAARVVAELHYGSST